MTGMAEVLDTDRPRARIHPFMGRARELKTFRGAFARMLDGGRQLVLLSGEPGIGKTRCAEAFAADAEDRGGLVLWGQCYEEPGAPPYWPWIQILRSFAEATSEDELRVLLGGTATDLAALVPEITGPGPAAGDDAPGPDPARARFRIFDAVARFLARAAEQVPIVLVIDNLHWADAPSLSLLEFASQELARSRVMLVGTYRDTEVSRKKPLLRTLGELGRDAGNERLRLGGLPLDAIAALAEQMLGGNLPEPQLAAIYQQTDGNPLFATELIRVLGEESADSGVQPVAIRIPDGVRETIGRRLTRLPDAANDLLAVAAVLGRRFAAREVATTADVDLKRVLEALQPAVDTGIVAEIPDKPGRYLFTHALIRETLYEETATLERMRLHAAAADALVALNRADPDSVLSRIAHHYHESAALGQADRAVEFGMRAAQRAARVHAYEEALLHYERVIEAARLCGDPDDPRLARAIVLKGATLKDLGNVVESIDALFEAITHIRGLDDTALFVDVVMLLAVSTSHASQQHIVPLIRQVLDALDDGDTPAHAKALATLAFVSRTTSTNADIRSLTDRALAMARRLGDARVLCACFQLSAMALRGHPQLLDARLELGSEHVRVAREAGLDDRLAEALHWQALSLLEAGTLDELEALLDEFDTLKLARLGLHEYHLHSCRVTLALLRGEWDGLAERIETLHELGCKTRRDDAEGVYGAQMFTLNRDRGRLPGYAGVVQGLLDGGAARSWKPGLMLMCSELGFDDEARRLLAQVLGGDGSTLQRDEMYVTCLVFCAQTCYRLGETDRAAQVYELLQPWAGQVANHPTAVCFGSTDLYLAMLATTAGHPEAAAHFEAALALNRAMRAWPVLARTQYAFGAWLQARDIDDDRDRGRDLLRDAEQLASRLGMDDLKQRIGNELSTAGPECVLPDGLTLREAEVLRLLAIGRSNKDIAKVLSISLNTVATHVRNILNKTGCANRTEAAAYAIRNGLTESC